MISAVLAAVMTVGMITGCGSSQTTTENKADKADKLESQTDLSSTDYDFEKELVTPQQQANNEGLEKILMYLPHEQKRVDDAENLFGNDYGSDDDLFTIIGNSDN